MWRRAGHFSAEIKPSPIANFGRPDRLWVPVLAVGARRHRAHAESRSDVLGRVTCDEELEHFAQDRQEESLGRQNTVPEFVELAEKTP